MILKVVLEVAGMVLGMVLKLSQAFSGANSHGHLPSRLMCRPTDCQDVTWMTKHEPRGCPVQHIGFNFVFIDSSLIGLHVLSLDPL